MFVTYIKKSLEWNKISWEKKKTKTSSDTQTEDNEFKERQ